MSESERQHDPAGAAGVWEAKRERLRLSEFHFQRAQDGHCAVEVELEWHDGAKVRGTARGLSSPTVDLRVAAEAALRALEQFSGHQLAFELIGVKAVRAFDANVIIVAVLNKRDGPAKLLGAHLCEHDLTRGAVVAVLSATNRLLGNFISRR